MPRSNGWTGALTVAAVLAAGAMWAPSSAAQSGASTLPAERPPAATQVAPPAATQPAVRYFVATGPVATANPHQKAELGGNTRGSPYKLSVNLTGHGAGIWEVRLTDYAVSAMSTTPYVPMGEIIAGPHKAYPFAAGLIMIDGERVDLRGVRQPWTLTAHDPPRRAVYELTIEDAQHQPVVTITREYSVTEGSYDLLCRQSIRNRTSRNLEVVWEQNIHGDVSADTESYVGEQRYFVAGYYNLDDDKERTNLETHKTFLPRASVAADAKLWPVRDTDRTVTRELIWIAAVNRYFAAVVHPVLGTAAPAGTQPATGGAGLVPLDANYPGFGKLPVGTKDTPGGPGVVFTLTSRKFALAPNATTGDNLDLALYVGPRDSRVFGQKHYDGLFLHRLVVYDLGGWCSTCNSQWLAQGLLWFMKGIHFVLRDWGLAIIVLVLIVRGLLHPITRKSQINMTKMGKQMASLAPEIEKIKKKFKDDSQRIQQETMKLYREKGVNPANMLGCLPMFLQMPIWISLYAMLYLAIELRHQPAFYGLFQAVSGGKWAFLADLSSPDNFIPLGAGFTVPLLAWHVTAVNIMPILMAGVFFVQQRYTTPPPANEQAAQQQKIMMWTTLLFPIMLYKAPCGLTLYILASTAAGIVDSYVVKRHIKKEEEAGRLFQPRSAKAGGLWDRLFRMVEQQQARLTGEKPGGKRYKDR